MKVNTINHVALVFDPPCVFARMTSTKYIPGSGVNTLLLYHSEDSSEDMSCGEDSPWGSPGSDGEGAFFLSKFL